MAIVLDEILPMSNSLRDQLLNLGFEAPAPEPKRKPQGKPNPHRSSAGKPAARSGAGGKPGGKPPAGGQQRRDGKPGGRRKPASEMDLGKAYALRAQKEKEERIAAEQAKQEAARLRREARAKLGSFLQGKTLNQAEADIARHFEYGGKIKRIYVTADQLKALNSGELGVVQLEGRYLLVTGETLEQAEQIFPACVALKVDPNAPAGDDPYSDPQYKVPDDLVW